MLFSLNSVPPKKPGTDNKMQTERQTGAYSVHGVAKVTPALVFTTSVLFSGGASSLPHPPQQQRFQPSAFFQQSLFPCF